MNDTIDSYGCFDILLYFNILLKELEGGREDSSLSCGLRLLN